MNKEHAEALIQEVTNEYLNGNFETFSSAESLISNLKEIS